jgi:S-adenosylmethionine synthetase
VGHPDSICDGIAEQVCVRLCRQYLDRFGEILHHNVDKVLLCAGAARPAFGGGEVVAPLQVYLAGRATAEYGGVSVPVHDIAVEACEDWLRSHIRFLDVERDVRITSRLRGGSGELTRMFGRGTERPLANDTSCGAGFAPLTELEGIVLGVERSLNSGDIKRAHPEIGEDIKVMGVRRDRFIRLTIGCAFIDRFVSDLDDYARKKAGTVRLAVAAARELSTLPVEVTVNAADGRSVGDVYLTATGTSAEAGDDGEAGRGNRVCGLITPYRPMTIEAAAGKNPVNHVGKLYNITASRIAASICGELPVVREAECVLVSRIGHPVDDPQVVDVGLVTTDGGRALHARVTEIVRSQLGQLGALRDELLMGQVFLF